MLTMSSSFRIRSMCMLLLVIPSILLVQSFFLKQNQYKHVTQKIGTVAAFDTKKNFKHWNSNYNSKNLYEKKKELTLLLSSSSSTSSSPPASSSQDFEDFSTDRKKEDFQQKKELSSMYESLKNRQDAIQKGIGKRYICRTQMGFLNVHREPCDPFQVDNIVSQLMEGQIVTSVGRQKDWIQHDAGGWSISKFGGFTFLEPIED